MLSMHSGGAFMKVVLKGSYWLIPGTRLIAWVEIRLQQNLRKLCPSTYTAIRNSFKTPSDLFIDKKVIKSQEGTIALAMYGVATVPLIDMLEDQNMINGTEMMVMWLVALNHCESCYSISMNMTVHSVILQSNLFRLQNLSLFRRRTKFFRDKMLILLMIIDFWVQLFVLIKTVTIFCKKIELTTLICLRS